MATPTASHQTRRSAMGRRAGSGERGFDLSDRGALGVADPLAAEAEKALLAGLGDPLGQAEDELPVLLDLLVGRLGPEQRYSLPDVVEVVLLELLRRAGSSAIHLGLGGGDFVEQLALAVLLPGLRVGLRHREGLANRAAAVREDHDQPGARGPLEDRLPLVLGEVSLGGHLRAVFRNSTERVARDRERVHVDPGTPEPDSLLLEQAALPIALGERAVRPHDPLPRDARVVAGGEDLAGEARRPGREVAVGGDVSFGDPPDPFQHLAPPVGAQPSRHTVHAPARAAGSAAAIPRAPAVRSVVPSATPNAKVSPASATALASVAARRRSRSSTAVSVAMPRTRSRMPAMRLTKTVAGLISLRPRARSDSSGAASIPIPIATRPRPEASDHARTSGECTGTSLMIAAARPRRSASSAVDPRTLRPFDSP